MTDNKENILADIKDEILKEISSASAQKKEGRRIPWGTAAVTMALILLTLLSVAQAGQSAVILNKINSGEFQAGGGAKGAAPLPASLDNLPNMVGGC